MYLVTRATASAIALLAGLLVAWPAAAQMPMLPELANPGITIDYIEPRDPKFEQHYERLKKRRALEDLAQFLSPLKLPRTLRLKTKQCGSESPFYDPSEAAIVFCYEYLEALDKIAPKEPTKDGVTRDDIVVGGYVDAMLHELGHALFDILGVPLFGRQEDAADQLAAFIMLQFGKDVARLTIKGAAYYYRSDPDPTLRQQYADEHGTSAQRFFNYICVAYGGDPAGFQDFVDTGILPKSRADKCPSEYKQVERAFIKTILPYIDQEKMKKVQSLKWLAAELK